MSKRTAEEAFQEETADSVSEAFIHDLKEKDVKVVDIKNSLDSDEEDEEEGDGQNYQILEEDDIEGQEDGAVGREGDIQLTPFNMKEELEEGHFDTDGMYHWNKEKLVKDHWLDNINWVKLKETKPEEVVGTGDDLKSAEFMKPLFDDLDAYKKMLALMKPNETVAKALRRLGGNKTMSASERLKKKKAEKQSGGKSEEPSDDSDNVNTMTELASNILTHTGNMDIYQETYEQIESKIRQQDQLQAKGGGKAGGDNLLDMYADDFDEKEKKKLVHGEEAESTSMAPVSPATNQTSATEEPSLQWEYKRNKDDISVDGPHSTEQMQKWTEEGKFGGDEIWVRKVLGGTGTGDFYSNRRVDFELYM
uniref:CD2 antigen cytoplasmic tail-binding protein 2 homolog n=1 Tax=Cacopsylla melanoneura TaxID=428564 RepID=A0A8D9AZ10_9HEMI